MQTVFDEIRTRLTVPLIAAPMFLVSSPELVTAACSAGVVGAFPTANARTTDELEDWLSRIRTGLAGTTCEYTGLAPAPVAPNLIVHASNARCDADLLVLQSAAPELVITSVGSPARAVGPLHDVGTLVFADVSSIRHGYRAIEAGADGLVLLTAGAGGQTGWANPFAFVRAVRQFFGGPVVVAGGISDGVALRAAIELGADLAYMGTKFIATEESVARREHKEALIASSLDDVVLTSAFTGLPTSILSASMPGDPTSLGTTDMARLLVSEGSTWKDISSCGHSVSGVDTVRPVADLVAATLAEYSGRGDRENVTHTRNRANVWHSATTHGRIDGHTT